MNRFKILRVYFFISLFLIYGLSINVYFFISFFKTSLIFNTAILIMFFIGFLVLLITTFKIFLLQENLEQFKLNFSKMKVKDYNSLRFILPLHIIQLFTKKIETNEKLFTEEERDTVIEFIEEDFKSKRNYISFTIENSLMLGLLGTFVGLLISITSLGGIVDLLVNMDNLEIKKVLASFGEPLKGMSVGFGSSLFGVSVAILLNLLVYILNKNFSGYLEELTETINLHLKPKEENVILTEQLIVNNKELIYMSEIYKLLKNMSNKDINTLLKDNEKKENKK